MACDFIDSNDIELADSFGKVFEQISDSTGADFLHMDPRKVTVGHTQASSQNSITLIEKISSDGTTFGTSLRLDDCNFVRLDLDAEDAGGSGEPQTGPIHLTLGRNVYSAHIDVDHRERAIHRMLSSDEKLLVVGDLGIKSFIIHAIQTYGSVLTGEDAQAALRTRLALAGALDALKDLEAPIAKAS